MCFSPPHQPCCHCPKLTSFHYTLPFHQSFNGTRAAHSRIIQTLLGRFFCSEYYACFVLTESVSCLCGDLQQTRAHILTDYPIYDAHRHPLRAVSRTLSLRAILSTKYGLEALAKFVTDPLPNHVHRCFARTCKGPILSGWNNTNTPEFVRVDMSMEVGMKSQYPEKWGLRK